MTAVVRQVPAAGSRCVVTGALVATEGRKAVVRTALYGPDGGPLAVARATWIALPEEITRPEERASSERTAGTQPGGA